MSRSRRWTEVYQARPPEQLRWHQDLPRLSLELIDSMGLPRAAVDVGGGASTLADPLVERGVPELLVLDLSEPALARVRARL